MHAVRTLRSTTRAASELGSARRAIGADDRPDEAAQRVGVPMRTFPGAVAIWVGLGAAGWASGLLTLRFIAGHI